MPDIVVSDVAAQKIAFAVESASIKIAGAIAGVAGTHVQLFGPAASEVPGSLVAIASSQEKQLISLTEAVNKNTAAIQDLIAATGKVAQFVEGLMKPLASMSYASVQSNTTAQLAYADQKKNNAFNQKTTNAAQERAGIEPTKVTQEDMKKEVGEDVQAALMVKGQTGAVDFISSTLTEYTAAGFKLATGWIAESTFGKWIESYYKEAVVQTKLLFADEKSKTKLNEELDKARSIRKNP